MISVLDIPEITTLKDVRDAVRDGLLDREDFYQWFERYLATPHKDATDSELLTEDRHSWRDEL
jgi:hypothetical protein